MRDIQKIKDLLQAKIDKEGAAVGESVLVIKQAEVKRDKDTGDQNQALAGKDLLAQAEKIYEQATAGRAGVAQSRTAIAAISPQPSAEALQALEMSFATIESGYAAFEAEADKLADKAEQLGQPSDEY